MKKIALAGLALLLVAGVSTIALAHGPGYGGGYGMGYGMGPGMMQGYGGYGMMGPGTYSEGNYPCAAWGNQETDKVLTKDSAKSFLEQRLAYTGNPNLKVGKIVEKDTYFEGEIVTKKGDSLVQKVQIDKNTGQTRSVY